MILVVFDIDGTLTDTQAIAHRVLVEAIGKVAGQPVVLPDFESLAEVTAPRLARVALARVLNRRVRDGEVYSVREASTARWIQGLQSGALTVPAMPGAAAILAQSLERPGYYAAVASGDWGPASELKLAAAGLARDDLVLASGDDAEKRAEILRTAEMVAAAKRGCFGFATTVLVGDGVWDGRAAREIGAGFIGVAADEAGVLRLRAAGAAAVVPDFTDTARFWDGVAIAVQHARASPGN